MFSAEFAFVKVNNNHSQTSARCCNIIILYENYTFLDFFCEARFDQDLLQNTRNAPSYNIIIYGKIL